MDTIDRVVKKVIKVFTAYLLQLKWAYSTYFSLDDYGLNPTILIEVLCLNEVKFYFTIA